ncbi:peptidase T [Halanaerobium saccharolyticum]|uniref:Peptidase T n=1 Tax=Halanaerobium saccharolyticum TaxID=43595 RepID=A0A4R7YL52_9FIRM|nr:peptidase T [Halanaerobium saccharolyticum]RAK03988.1 peptidase T [Halanaerobium saccharolyticum]TDV97339.1 peptidase T [Halanaerobium saccharolyticum]TDX49106.1 peptidase T [Halanaerobium saccharolyticum]
MDKIVERFKRYIAVDTKSDSDSETVPSTKGQLELGELLVEELNELGLKNVKQDESGYIYAELPSNIDKEVPTIGFIAHLDTSPDLDGKVTNPQIVDYKGGDIKLNDNYSLTPDEFPVLEKLKGKTLITTDGTTLLGADDKAGIAEILTALDYIISNPEIKHGCIKVGFTPDEEIGRGADHFDVETFAADFAYTLDGGPLGELQYENFNAASADLKIQGKNVHPGTAKNLMVNSIKIAMELDSMLPTAEAPEHTEGYEGFYHLTDIEGSVDYTELNYIIRDFSQKEFENKKALMQQVVDFLNDKYGEVIELKLEDSYYNMKEKVEPHFEIIELAKKSMEELGIKADIKPIRGGTDGARLSYMGLPTPNLFAGGYNFHGRFEFIPVENMKRATELIVKIAENAAQK